MKYHILSWNKLHNDSFKLAKTIESSEEQFDLIVTMARGGLTIAHIISDFLKLPIASFTIKSYAKMKQKSEPVITHSLGGKMENKSILLLDDVSDTGKTFFKGVDYMKKLQVKKLKTAALYIKPQTTFVPDYYSKVVDAWIVYPYDMRETVEAIEVQMKEKGMKPNSIKRRLVNLGIPKRFIEEYL